MQLILDTITEQGNSIRVFACEAEPMMFYCRINGNVRPIREVIYQLNRSRLYQARLKSIGGLGC